LHAYVAGTDIFTNVSLNYILMPFPVPADPDWLYSCGVVFPLVAMASPYHH
jgi:hypothetical protein